MKKLPLIIPAVFLIAIFICLPVHAAEITPNSSTYGYGSTSEFSDNVVATQGSSSSLANTGESAIYILIAALVLIGGGVLCLRYVIQKSRK